MSDCCKRNLSRVTSFSCTERSRDDDFDDSECLDSDRDDDVRHE
jgi:hypothetical protein